MRTEALPNGATKVTRKKPILFPDTKAVYRDIFDEHALPILSNAESHTVRALQQEEAYLAGLYKDLLKGQTPFEVDQSGRVLSSSLPPVESPARSRSISVQVMSEGEPVFIPLALPVDYMELNRRDRTYGQNVLQVFLNDVKGERIEQGDVGKIFGVTRQGANNQIDSNFNKLLKSSTQYEGRNVGEFSFDKKNSEAEFTRREIVANVKSGSDYFDLREKGFSAQQINDARQRTNPEEAVIPRYVLEKNEIVTMINDPRISKAERRRLIKYVGRGTYARYSNCEGEDELPELVNRQRFAKECGLTLNAIRKDGDHLTHVLERDLNIPIGILVNNIKNGPRKGVLRTIFLPRIDVQEAKEYVASIKGDERIEAMRKNGAA